MCTIVTMIYSVLYDTIVNTVHFVTVFMLQQFYETSRCTHGAEFDTNGSPLTQNNWKLRLDYETSFKSKTCPAGLFKVCLFACFEPHEEFFSYLAAIYSVYGEFDHVPIGIYISIDTLKSWYLIVYIHIFDQ
jgi:hypothetical protein